MTVHLQGSGHTCNRSTCCVAVWLAQGGTPVQDKGPGLQRVPRASLCVNGGRMSEPSLGVKNKGSGPVSLVLKGRMSQEAPGTLTANPQGPPPPDTHTHTCTLLLGS